MNEQQTYTEDEVAEIARNFADKQASPQQFFLEVMRTDDTTKVGFLTQEELGLSNHPLRTYKELEVFSEDVLGDDSWASYFKKIAEVQTATSLSKNAKLLSLVGTKRQEFADETKKAKLNKGWFKKKDNKEEEQ